MGGNEDENPIWSAIAEPLSSLVGLHQNDDKEASRKAAAKNEEAYKKRFRKRLQGLQTEVEEVNEEATRTRQQLWEAQDKLRSSEDQIRKLENHLNEILELREKDLESLKSLRAANSECVEMESRAREAMEVFKKCYKRAQLKLKENEEEIAMLREQRNCVERAHDMDTDVTDAMIDGSALEYIKTVSNEKEERLKQMLFHTENEVDLWKSKYKVASRRCVNFQEQITAIEHPSEASVYMEKQRIKIEQLEDQLEETRQLAQEKVEERDDALFYPGYTVDSIVHRGLCDEDLNGSVTKDLMKTISKLNCAGLPTMPNA